MRIKALVMKARLDLWFKGDRKNEREVLILELYDQDELESFPNTFDYRLSQDEMAELPLVPDDRPEARPGAKRLDISAFKGALVEISARDWKVQKGGRLLFLGRLVALPTKSVGNGAAPKRQTAVSV